MTNVLTSAQTAPHLTPESKGRRKRKRLTINVPIHVRPVYPEGDGLVEVTKTIDFNRKSVCFVGLLRNYQVGMVLFVALSFSSATSVPQRVLGEVVRIEKLANDAQAVAVKFLNE